MIFELPIYYSNSSYESIADGEMRVCQLGVASLICICILALIPQTMGQFTDVGKYTLSIYLLHPPMIKLMNVGCSYAGIERNLLIAIAMTIIVVVTLYSIRNLKILRCLQ